MDYKLCLSRDGHRGSIQIGYQVVVDSRAVDYILCLSVPESMRLQYHGLP